MKRGGIVRLGLMKAVQIWADREASFKKARRLIEKSLPQKPDIVITSECWLNGYREFFEMEKKKRPGTFERDCKRRLEKLNGKYIKLYRAFAKESGIYIVLGAMTLERGKPYNSAILIDRKGEILGVYHKNWTDPDKDLLVFETELGKIGLCICYDRQLPETCRVLRLKGAEMILIPTYGMKNEMNKIMMQTRAYENGVFVAFNHPSQSLVTDPAGDVLLNVRSKAEGVFCQDVDLSRVTNKNLVVSAAGLKLYKPYAKKWGLKKKFQL